MYWIMLTRVLRGIDNKKSHLKFNILLQRLESKPKFHLKWKWQRMKWSLNFNTAFKNSYYRSATILSQLR